MKNKLNKDQKQKLKIIQKTLTLISKNIEDVSRNINELSDGKEDTRVFEKSSKELEDKIKDLSVSEDERVVEGVFNGQNMIGPDDRMYPVPANYASKSKLVEGDVLKLTIQADGSFVFKQIGPVERKKLIGQIIKDGEEYIINVDKRQYKVLLASVTYFKAEDGDEVTIIVPEDTESTWAAIENVIKKNGGDPTEDLDEIL